MRKLNLLPDPDSMRTGTTGPVLDGGIFTGFERAGRDPGPVPTSTASISVIDGALHTLQCTRKISSEIS